jgi:CRP/FNR family transcriptional regulator
MSPAGDPVALLQRLPLFAAFEPTALRRLAQRSVLRSHPAGSLLFTAGEPYRGLYVIASGRVRIYRASPSGREQVLHTEGPGQPVAELPLFDGGPYPASAITEEPSVLLFVPRAEFEALYRTDPDVAAAIIRDLGRRLRHLVQLTQTLAFRDVAARLALYLAALADRTGTESADGVVVTLDRTREALSVELGTARESVSRAFKQLREKGLVIEQGRRRLLLPDVGQLRTLARPGERPRYEEDGG